MASKPLSCKIVCGNTWTYLIPKYDQTLLFFGIGDLQRDRIVIIIFDADNKHKNLRSPQNQDCYYYTSLASLYRPIHGCAKHHG